MSVRSLNKRHRLQKVYGNLENCATTDRPRRVQALTPAPFCGKLLLSITRFCSPRKELRQKPTVREAQRQDWERGKLRSLLQHASPYQATVSTVAGAAGQMTSPVDEVEVPRRRPGENREIGGCLQGHATALRFSSRKQRLKTGWRQPEQHALAVAIQYIDRLGNG